MRTVVFSIVVVVISVTGILPTAVAKDIQWLGYRLWGQGQRNIPYLNAKMLDVSDQMPDDVSMPEFNSASPFFAKWESPMAEGGFLWIAFDGEHKYGPRNRLFIDSDGDGRLDDETAYSAYKVDRDRSYFQGVKVVFSGEDGPVTYHLHFQLRSEKTGGRLQVRSNCWYEGVISVGGDKKVCALFDNNANGTFNDKSDVFSRSDRIKIGGRDAGFVGNYVEVDGVLYELEVARDGAYVELNRAENVVFGEVRVQEAVSEFAAGGVNGLLAVKPQNGVARLPIGKYRIHHWLIDRKDKAGNNWKLDGRGFDEKGDFAVSDGNTVSLGIGEPVVAELKVDGGGTKFSLQQELKGQLGERVSIKRNNLRLNPPQVRITSADGKYDRKFSFEYG